MKPYDNSPRRLTVQEQDKSSDIEQQPPFGDRKISNIQPQNRGGGLQKSKLHKDGTKMFDYTSFVTFCSYTNRHIQEVQISFRYLFDQNY